VHATMRETVRSGRRENFYVTDNGFIDHYAREMQPVDVAVYHALERYANCHTRSTWVGTAKIAEVLNVSQRTVQRSLKVLEDLKLIRIVQTSTVKMYFLVPVPPRAKAAATPLFDAMELDELSAGMSKNDDNGVAWATAASHVPSGMSRGVSPLSPVASVASLARDIADGPYKEEQNLSNKTNHQDLLNKTSEKEPSNISAAAERVVRILGLHERFIDAAASAVEVETRETGLSADEVVQEIWKKATRADRRNVSREKFIDDYLAQKLAERIIDSVNLPPSHHLTTTVVAALKVEARDIGRSLPETADSIIASAIDDRRKGVEINKWYFENCKWRSNARVSKAEQRKLDNLEVNARVKQRLREKLGVS